MKKNIQVTNNEFVIQDNRSLVTETDLKGKILYANDDFIEVSGYSWEELEGAPHNIVRHPDVPRAVYRDLWKTLEAGRPWHQFVKNRRKNGDHYWVESNIAPVFENGKITRYKSVRIPIERDAIPLAEQAYADINSGKKLIVNGVLTTKTQQFMARWSPLPKNSLMGKLLIPLIAIAVIWSIVLQVYLQNVADNLYEDAIVERHQNLQANLITDVDSLATIALTNAVGIAGNSAVIYGLYDKQDTVLWQILQVNYEHYVKSAKLDGIGIAIFDQQLREVTKTGAEVSLTSLPKEPVTKVAFESGVGYVEAVVPVPYGDQILGAVVMSIPLSHLANANTSGSSLYATAIVQDAQPDLVATGFANFAQVQSAITPAQLKTLLKETRLVTQDYLFISVPIKQDEEVVGVHLVAEPMMILHRVLSDSYFMIYVAQGAMSGGFILLLLQVFTRMRQSVLKPLKQMAEKFAKADKEGSLSVRTELLSCDEIGRVGASFNGYISSVQHLMVSVSDMIQGISKGNLALRIHADAQGDLNSLKEEVNQSADNIQNVMNELQAAIVSLRASDYSFQATGQYSGEYFAMINDLQAAMHETQMAVNGINQAVVALAQGDFSGRIEQDLLGELGSLKENFNHSLDQLEQGITETVDVVVAQSKGDLTSRIVGDYQGKLAVMKDAVNSSINNMANALAEIMSASVTVANATDQIASGNSNLSDRIQNQAAALQETVSTVASITQVVRENSEYADQAASLASTTKDQAINSSEVMKNAQTAMSELAESSNKIADIIALIDGIAFQTNLLALNAAVEAARAGEQGRGFAVVAGEVRSLAQKSAEAAADIRQLIEQSVKQVGQSQELVADTGKEFDSIVESIVRMHDFVSEIARANSAQSHSIEQINQAVDEMDIVTQQNAALVEETAAASETLREESQEMQKQVSFFKIEDRQNLLTYN